MASSIADGKFDRSYVGPITSSYGYLFIVLARKSTA
jgi:hypothetical protein